MASSNSIDLAALRLALVRHSAEAAIAVLGPPNWPLCNEHELRFGNRGSLAVTIEGPKAGLWYDHENAEGGDLLALMRRMHGGEFSKAVSFAVDIIGNVPRAQFRVPQPASRQVSSDVASARQRALELWAQAKPVEDSSAAVYLEWRSVLPAALAAGKDVLRFHASCPFGPDERHPCMLTLMRDIHSNEPRAVQRTALSASFMQTIRRLEFADFARSGQKIVRMALGPKTGTAIKLSRDEDVTLGLAIGEGTESVLAAMQLGFRPAWALGGTAGISSFPVLSGMDALTILVDNDSNGAGQRAAGECSDRWTRAGREVFRAIPRHTGDDFNDVLHWRTHS